LGDTVIFSLVEAVLLKLPPVKEPEKLVLLSYQGRRGSGDDFPYGAYLRFRDRIKITLMENCPLPSVHDTA
jgi:hypothetical protein